MSGLRNTLNGSPAVAWGVVGAVVLVTLLVFANQRGGKMGVSAWFFDLNTGKLVEGWSSTLSPDPESPSAYAYPDGEAGSIVRANLMACPGEGEAVKAGMTLDEIEAAGAVLVSFVRVPTESLETQQKLRAGETVSEQEVRRFGYVEMVVGDPTGANWYKQDSHKAVELLAPMTGRCGSERAVFVNP